MSLTDGVVREDAQRFYKAKVVVGIKICPDLMVFSLEEASPWFVNLLTEGEKDSLDFGYALNFDLINERLGCGLQLIPSGIEDFENYILGREIQKTDGEAVVLASEVYDNVAVYVSVCEGLRFLGVPEDRIWEVRTYLCCGLD